MGLRRVWERIGRQERPAPARRGPAPRVAIYAREERDAEGRLVLGVEAQEEECRAFAARQGWEVVATFADRASEPEAPRDGLKALRGAIWSHRFDAVVSSTPERLYYDIERLVLLAREARLLGVALIFVETPRGLDLDSEEF